MRCPLLPALLLGVLAALGGADASAAPLGTYLFDPGGEVRDVRALDMDGDGRRDLVVLLRAKDGTQQVLVLRTPETPVPRTLYAPAAVTRVPLNGDLAHAGALAVGRFGPGGEGRLRFLGPRAPIERTATGAAAEAAGRASLFARSAGRPLVFWDGVADLDGDGRDECWYPLAEGDGPIYVQHGADPAGDRTLGLAATNQAASGGSVGLARHAYVPNLFPADLDGDGRRELLALRDGVLLGWSPTQRAGGEAGQPLAPAYRLVLPFLGGAETRSPEELHTPRVQLEDVDGDGRTDLLVTLITGVRTRLASIRTIFFHYPGPFRDAEGGLVEPAVRIDTQSIVLHPTFVDLDGDGAAEYVGDSIRGTMLDLLARMMGRDPEITFVGFAFDRTTGRFRESPTFTLQRTYAAEEALSNRFGRSAWFEGDFDGDGHRDLLDLGDLKGVEILRGATQEGTTTFAQPLLPRVPVAEGLVADARIADLDGDGRSDAVMWSRSRLYLVLSGGKGR